MEEDLKQEIDAAVKVLKEGGVILYPTDTVWGIGCDAADKDAVARVFEIKQRSDAKSLITLVADADMIGRYVKVIPQMAIELIEVNDKPMTIIYPGAMGLAENVVAEDGSVGIRIPQSEFCRQLCRRFAGAIVSTSANISGEDAPASFEDINAAILDEVDHIVDPCYEEGATGVSSQIIKVGLDGEVKVIRE
ncbi:MAG: threonylcarbamoyl-AMP synthase [Bacteroidales bacterium]|jgi:L-threonylcarbamoyladenylate synthase|nr:threonylcarbamoyl-AMP synthase [Bacteroidales bacterium]